MVLGCSWSSQVLLFSRQRWGRGGRVWLLLAFVFFAIAAMEGDVCVCVFDF